MSGVVYTLDENNFIVSEQRMDFSYAVARYHGHRDPRGRKYYVSVEGKEVPFRKKPKKLIDLKQDNSEAKDQTPIVEPSL